MPIFRKHRASEGKQKPVLRVLSSKSPDEKPGRICPLRRGNNIVGRSEPVDVVIRDPMVSRQHACITVSSDQAKFTIQDNNSRNGTYLKDGAKITDKPQPIAPGAILLFGSTEVVLEYEGELQATGLRGSLSQKTSLAGLP